mgnify:FL=1
MRSRSNILEKVLSIFLALSLLLLSSCTKKPKKYSSSKADSVTVYVTDTGHKYHKKNCSYLKYSKNEITLSEAIDENYSPCLVCVPPEIE